MLHHEFWLGLEYLPIAEQIGATWLFPLVNSLHVLSVTLMLGALLMLDLRLAGLAARLYPISDLSRDFLPWIWTAFIIAVISGLGLFITRASAHVLNPAFQWKIVLMVCAGVNMLALHWLLKKLPADFGGAKTPPLWIRFSGVTSLLLWAGVMLGGRWMGHII
jgi:hypothetical protein